MGFGFNLFFIFILLPLTGILLIAWLLSKKVFYGKALGLIWLGFIGLVLLSGIVSLSLIGCINEKRKTKKDYFLPQYYSGVVTNKFIDSSQHMSKKVFIKEKYGTKIILFDGEVGGMFDFIKIGDSINKQEGTNEVRVRRKKLDTVISLRFYETE